MTDSMWHEDEKYPMSDWQYEVANGDTLLGYWSWVTTQRELAVGNHIPGSVRMPVCGRCEQVIHGEEVRIRHPAAPNPMHKQCAETWKPPFT